MKTGTLIALVSCLVLLSAWPAVAQTQTGPFPLASQNVPARYGTVASGVATLPTAPSAVVPPAVSRRPFSRYQPQTVTSPLMGFASRNANSRANSYYRFTEEQLYNEGARAESLVQQRRVDELTRREQAQFDGLYGTALLGATQLEVTKLRRAGGEVSDYVIDKMTEQANKILKDLEEERKRRGLGLP